MESAGQQTENVFEAAANTFNSITGNQELNGYLLSPIGDKTLLLHDFLSTFQSFNLDIDDFALFSPNLHWSGLFTKSELKGITKDISKSKLVPVGITNPTIDRDRSARIVFAGSVYGKIGGEHYRQCIGYVVLSVRPEKLIKYPLTTENLPIKYYFVDENGKHVNLSDEEYITGEIEDILNSYTEKNTQTNNISTYKTNNYVVFTRKIGETNCKIVGIIPIEYTNSQVYFTLITIVVICCIVLLFILILFWFVFSKIISPINRLECYIREVRASSATPVTSVITVDGCAEIYSLSQEFNQLIKQNTQLNSSLFQATQNLYELDLEKERTQIAHLRSQINPHFLYNTLESIKGLALESNNHKIADISTAMGKMFRYNIKGKPIVMLEEELEIAKAYLEIQSSRFPDKILTIYSLSDEARKCYVNKMLLQPIIENSIVHGLTSKSEGGMLWIGGKTEEEDLILTVQDNGTGIEQGLLNDILSRLQGTQDINSDEKHIGLVNVHRRIRLEYGKPYGVELQSQLGIGTKVTLRMPAIFKLEEGDGVDVQCFTSRR